jgi:hypothetical protein
MKIADLTDAMSVRTPGCVPAAFWRFATPATRWSKRAAPPRAAF